MKNISIIGGDLRIVKLADMLKSDGYEVYTYGLEQACSNNDIVKCTSIEEARKDFYCRKNRRGIISKI